MRERCTGGLERVKDEDTGGFDGGFG